MSDRSSGWTLVSWGEIKRQIVGLSLLLTGCLWLQLSPGTVGLLLQVCCIYLAVCWQRRFSREWWGGLASPPYAGSSDPAVDFSAVYSMLGSPFAAKVPLFVCRFSQNSLILVSHSCLASLALRASASSWRHPSRA